jgi:hypothetical protein
VCVFGRVRQDGARELAGELASHVIVRAAAAGIPAALVLGLACTRVSDHQRFELADEPLTITASVPSGGAVDVPTTTAVDLCFSNLVDPRSILVTDAQTSSGQSAFDSELSLQLLPWTGPGGEALTQPTAPWCDGSVLSVVPKAELSPSLLYRVRVVPRARGWGGEILDTTTPGWVVEGDRRRYTVEFTTAATPATVDPPPPVVVGIVHFDELFTDGRVFDPRRAICSCHRDPDDLAYRLLDLDDRDTAWAQLALETRARDTGFPMISQRRASESFLVHKLLRDDDGEALQDVLGDPMPPDEPLPYADYVDVATWIQNGAQR